jgi:hypothetical protein
MRRMESILICGRNMHRMGTEGKSIVQLVIDFEISINAI